MKAFVFMVVCVLCLVSLAITRHIRADELKVACALKGGQIMHFDDGEVICGKVSKL